MTEDPRELEEAQETLRQLEARLRRDVHDMLAVLSADVPAFVSRTVRAVFEERDEADRLDAAGVRKLKEATAKASRELQDELGRRLAPFEVWSWQRQEPPPRDAKDLSPNPEVSATLDRIGEVVARLLEGAGIRSALGERAAYKLPTYFVAGHFMRSLVESYWQTLAAHHELAARVRASSSQEQRKARRQRWDQA
jgi:hypothetical protein